MDINNEHELIEELEAVIQNLTKVMNTRNNNFNIEVCKSVIITKFKNYSLDRKLKALKVREVGLEFVKDNMIEIDTGLLEFMLLFHEIGIDGTKQGATELKSRDLLLSLGVEKDFAYIIYLHYITAESTGRASIYMDSKPYSKYLDILDYATAHVTHAGRYVTSQEAMSIASQYQSKDPTQYEVERRKQFRAIHLEIKYNPLNPVNTAVNFLDELKPRHRTKKLLNFIDCLLEDYSREEIQTALDDTCNKLSQETMNKMSNPDTDFHSECMETLLNPPPTPEKETVDKVIKELKEFAKENKCLNMTYNEMMDKCDEYWKKGK